MTASDFILENLRLLKRDPVPHDWTDDVLTDKILQIVISKKFRQFPISQTLIDSVRDTIKTTIGGGYPMQFLFPQGLYKLWRLPEAPEADWAELFFLMYCAKSLSEICAIYAPGAELDLFVDDLIDEKLNNLTPDELTAYRESFLGVIRFVKSFLPDNLNIKMTRVSQLFESEDAFWESFNRNLAKTPLPELSQHQKDKVELNVRLLPGQDADPEWREKVMQIHNAFSATKKEPGYHHGRKDKVLLSADPVPSGVYVEIGT
ncbi:MAG: hypothetical protein FWC51_03540, partial [Proteobacteria bacterium]|nr:hypothetical protein [Pseudomonadota bacterium]